MKKIEAYEIPTYVIPNEQCDSLTYDNLRTHEAWKKTFVLGKGCVAWRVQSQYG